MAFNTKLKLIDAKFEQVSGGTLTLSGNTLVADSGTFKYATGARTFTEDGELIDKYYVDQQVSGDTTYDTVWMSGVTETGGTLKTWYDVTQSAGRISGGTITEGTTGTVNVAAGAGLIKDGTGRTDQNRYVTWDAVSNLAVVTGYNFIYYNADTNQITATTDEAEITRNDNFNLGRVYYDTSVGMIIRLCGQNLWNLNRRIHLYGDEVYGVQRASGMAISSTSGLTFQVSGGVLWAELLNRFATEDFDSITDSFREWTYTSSTWSSSVVTAPGDLDNTLYNPRAGSGSLPSLTAGYYTIRWIYVVHDSSAHVVFADSEYSGVTEALNANPPATLPDLISGYATLVGRVIVQEGNSDVVDISSAFDQVFTTGTVQAHNELSGIQGGQAGEYYHLTASEATSINDIPDMKEVTDIAVTGATNGISKYDAHNVALGGTLTGDTNIDLVNGGLTLCETSGNISYQFDNIGMILNQNGSCVYLTNSGNDFLFKHRQGKTTCVTNSGLTYAGDYSSSFIGRSLVDKEYVDGATGSLSGASGVDRVGDNIVLGGNALTADTTITTTGYDFNICNAGAGLTNIEHINGADCALIRAFAGGVGGTVLLCATDLMTFCFEGSAIFNAPSSGWACYASAGQPASFTANAIPNVGYVTGLTNGIGDRVTTIETDYITGGTSGIDVDTSNHDLKLGGTLTEDTNLAGSYEFNLNVNEICLTGATAGVKIGGNSIYFCTLTGADDLICINETTGELGTTSLSAFGGITGGTNGVCDHGNQNLGLGGALVENTAIDGDFDLCLGTNASNINSLQVFTDNGITLDSDQNLVLAVSGGTITTDDGQGLRYTGTYESSFVNSSLVSKCYVDTVATGLQPHDTVLVATTGNIALSGLSTIDGIALSELDRVLVKDQTTGADNGIYVASTGEWGRATDFDGTPVGEVVNGDLVPVESGNTHANTIWVLTTPDPITVGSTALDFTLFSRLLGISAGNGIDVTPNGSTQEVSVDLAANGGLCIVSTELSVDDTIAGNALTWNAGILNVNACSAEGDIDVNYNSSGNLVVAGSDVNTALGGVISGVTNGICETDGVAYLGGSLTEATSLTINSDSNTLTVTDAAVSNKEGIKYAADYSTTFTCLSIPNVAFVTGCTSAITVDAANGLSKDGNNNIVLGGSALTGTTTICGDSNILNLGATGSAAGLISATNINASQFGICGDDGVAEYIGMYLCPEQFAIYNFGDSGYTMNGSVSVLTNQSRAEMVASANNTCCSSIKLDGRDTSQSFEVLACSTANGTLRHVGCNISGTQLFSTEIFRGASNNIKFEGNNLNKAFSFDIDGFEILSICSGTTARYAQAIEASCITADGDLTNKIYVDTCVNSLTGVTSQAITGATNGLCKTGQDVILGGTLTGNTLIDTGGNKFCVCSPNNNTFLNVEDTQGRIIVGTIGGNYGQVDVGTSLSSIGTHSSSNNATLTAIPTLLRFVQDNLVRTCHTDIGFFYTNDWSTGSTTARWIPDRGYVDTCVNSQTSGITATAITGATNGVCKNGQDVYLGGTLTENTTINGDGGTYSLDLGGNGDELSSLCVRAVSTDICGTLSATGAATLNSTLNVSGNTVIGGTLSVETVNSGSVTTDNVLVIDSTGEVKSIAADTLGEDNNIYTISGITANTTLDNTYYTVLADSTGGAFTISLPAAPDQGQAYKIKDSGGNALTNNITISGNGNNIDGSASASINTDYGALELVYDSTEDAWFALSFVN